MPYVNIQIAREGATVEQKAELIQGVTDLLVRVLNKNLERLSSSFKKSIRTVGASQACRSPSTDVSNVRQWKREVGNQGEPKHERSCRVQRRSENSVTLARWWRPH